MSRFMFKYKGDEYKVPAKHYSIRAHDAVFFYGGEFSNFAPGPFEIRDFDGARYLGEVTGIDSGVPEHREQSDVAQSTHIREYATIEHYFQACKAITQDEHDWIADASGPWEAKKRGRGTSPLRPDWEDVKVDVMLHGLRHKFVPGSQYANTLLGTGGRYIAEDSPTDAVWGIRAADGALTGDNLLGEALMQIRDELNAAAVEEADEMADQV